MDGSNISWLLPVAVILYSIYRFSGSYQKGPQDPWLKVSLAVAMLGGGLTLYSLPLMVVQLLGWDTSMLALLFMFGFVLITFSVFLMSLWNTYMCESGQLEVAGARAESIFFACDMMSLALTLVSFTLSWAAILLVSDLKPNIVKGASGKTFYDVSPFNFYMVIISLAFLLLSIRARRKLVTTLILVPQRSQPVVLPPQKSTGASYQQIKEKKEIKDSGLLLTSFTGLALYLVLLFVIPASLDQLGYNLAFLVWLLVTFYFVKRYMEAPMSYLVTMMSNLLSFYCPRCQKKIESFEKSGSLLEHFINGRLSLKGAQERVIVAHYRHVHTEYEKEIRDLQKVRSPLLNKEQRREELKREYSEKARFLAEKDGLLKEK